METVPHITFVTTPKGRAFIFGEGTFARRAEIRALGFTWDRNHQSWQGFNVDADAVAQALGLQYRETIASEKQGEERIYK